MSRAKRKKRGHGLTSASQERRKLERERPQGVQTSNRSTARRGHRAIDRPRSRSRTVSSVPGVAPSLGTVTRRVVDLGGDRLVLAATQRGRGNVTQLPPWFASLTNDTSRRSPGLGLRVECRRGDLDTEEIPPPPQWFCGAEPAEDQPASDIPSPAVAGDTKAPV